MTKRVLKPCPFCGGNARVMEDERFKKKSHDFPKWAILCMGCGVRTPTADMVYVVKIWNRRVTAVQEAKTVIEAEGSEK